MLKYPSFPTNEYNHVRCPLAVASLFSKVKTAEARRARHEAEFNRLSSECQQFETAIKIREQYGQKLDELAQFRSLAVEQRRYRLSEMYRSLHKSATYPGQFNTNQLALQLLALYGTADVSAFQEDLLAIAANGTDTVELTTQRHREEQEIQRADRDIENLWFDAADCFTTIPRSWREVQPQVFHKPEAVPELDDEGKRRIAKRMLLDFCADWKSRVRHFDKTRPVTVAGIAIDTMPRSTRDAWLKAYEKLGLDQIPRAPYFAPILRQKSEAEKLAEVEETQQAKTGGILAKVFG